MFYFFVFFKQKTAYEMRISDWSSDVCSSDLVSVIEYHGTVQGFLVLIPEIDALLLDNVAVSTNVRGSEIGRVLLEFAERSAIEAGYRQIRLYINEAMTENFELYRRIGYTETHRAKVKGLQRVYMAKVLRSEEHTSELQSLMRRSYAV